MRFLITIISDLNNKSIKTHAFGYFSILRGRQIRPVSVQLTGNIKKKKLRHIERKTVAFNILVKTKIIKLKESIISEGDICNFFRKNYQRYKGYSHGY